MVDMHVYRSRMEKEMQSVNWMVEHASECFCSDRKTIVKACADWTLILGSPTFELSCPLWRRVLSTASYLNLNLVPCGPPRLAPLCARLTKVKVEGRL